MASGVGALWAVEMVLLHLMPESCMFVVCCFVYSVEANQARASDLEGFIEYSYYYWDSSCRLL
jgi:hypothetical protein